jgi:hypothetical protein
MSSPSRLKLAIDGVHIGNKYLPVAVRRNLHQASKLALLTCALLILDVYSLCGVYSPSDHFGRILYKLLNLVQCIGSRPHDVIQLDAMLKAPVPSITEVKQH